MYKAIHISPMIPSFDIRETVYFFQDVLDFKISINENTYAILNKNKLTIHILPAGSDIGEMEFYLEVDEIEKVWNLVMWSKIVGNFLD